MSILTILLDSSVLNGYDLHRSIAPDCHEKILQLREFKRHVAEAFVAPSFIRRQERITVRPLSEN